MISYGHRKSIDEKLATAERRLIRLRQMEQDARVVLRRRTIERRSAEQSRGFMMSDYDNLVRRWTSACDRLNQVQAAILEQQTVVRHLREGQE